MKALVVIPARGGSKGLPGKNLALVAGRSLLAWAEAAVPEATAAVVTTDDDTIAAATTLPVIRRPAYLAQDHTPDLPVAQHALAEWGWWTHQHDDDILIWLRPTAPFRQPADVQAVVDFMVRHTTVDSVRSVLPARPHPAKCYRERGELGGVPWLAPWGWHDHRPNHPRQLLPPAWQACGWIDAVRIGVVGAGSMEGDRIAGRHVPDPHGSRGHEIDAPVDLEMANVIARHAKWRPGHCP